MAGGSCDFQQLTPRKGDGGFLAQLAQHRNVEPNAFFLGYFEGFESQCAEFSECTEPFFCYNQIDILSDQPNDPKGTLSMQRTVVLHTRLDIMGCAEVRQTIA